MFHSQLARPGEQLQQVVAQLEQSESAFRSLLDSFPDGVVFLDPVDFKIITCNPAYARMNGYTQEELTGQPAALLSPFPRTQADRSEYSAILQERGSLTFEAQHLRKDGSIFPVEVSSTLVQLEGRQVVLGIDRDISMRRRIEMELQATTLRQHDLVSELEMQNKEFGLLNEMTQALESCSRLEETTPILAQFSALLFPGHATALFLAKTEAPEMSCVMTHGCDPALRLEEKRIAPSWETLPALSSGRLPVDQCAWIDFLPKDETIQTGCYPLHDQNGWFGLFYVQFAPGAGPARWNLRAEKVAACLSLILANIQLRESLQQQSIRDSLTNLFNRRYMEETLEREISRCWRGEHPLSVAMLDIDHFKKYNDAYGHPAGDQVLKRFGEHLVKHLRKEDVVCRYGGEEFVLILPEMLPDVALARLDSIRLKWLEENSGVTFSGGVASFPTHGEDAYGLVLQADQALYRAKGEGRNRVVVAG